MAWVGNPDNLCGETAGFLFSHRCDRPFINTCLSCQKPICGDHTRVVQQRMVCVGCARQHGNVRSPYDSRDPYFYRGAYVESYYGSGGYGDRSGSWHDSNDFTESDGTNLKHEGAASFEDDLDAS